MKKLRIIIEVSPITEARMSGIGHATLEIIRNMSAHPQNGKEFELMLVAGYDKVQKIKDMGIRGVSIKAIPLPQRVINLIWKFNLLPPMDVYLGRAVYIFPNYKNWPLLFSKSLTYVHDIGYLLYPQFVSPKNRIFLARNMPKWLKRTNLVVADSMSAKKEIVEYCHIPESKVKVIYHGVDSSKYYPISKLTITKIKAKYGIKGDYLLFLGSIEPRKNIERLLDAYKLLPASLRKKYALVLVGGSGWLNEPILKAISKYKSEGLNIIRPNKFVPDKDLPALHSGATLLVHPAIYEGFGLSIVQAMACGTPVLVGDNSSMSEVVGDNGILVNALSVSDIEKGMEKALTNKNLLKELSEKGKKRADFFSWQSSVDKLVNLAGEIK